MEALMDVNRFLAWVLCPWMSLGVGMDALFPNINTAFLGTVIRLPMLCSQTR